MGERRREKSEASYAIVVENKNVKEKKCRIQKLPTSVFQLSNIFH